MRPRRRPAPDDAVSDLAHSLRTPLAVITGYAELLKHRDDETTRREAAVQIAAAAERLADAIDELLADYAEGTAPLRDSPASGHGGGETA